MNPHLSFGIDQLIQHSSPAQYGRIGLVTNDAAYTTMGQQSRLALLEADFSIQKLFSPEHGLSAKGPDGAFIPNGVDSLTALPIVSLYGEKLAPDSTDLTDIDTVFFDIPDIGLRYYTYLWTLTHVLEACSAHQKKLVILDRPNPLSGSIEGPMLEEKNCSSFIGRWNIPVRHGCTLGELAMFFNAEKNLQVDLQVVSCKGWNRTLILRDYGMPFQPTSPAIVSWECMLAYPITAYLEATNLSDGRGTNVPFAQIGAPWLQGFDLSKLQGLTEDVVFENCQFVPSEGKYMNEVCYGIKIRVKKAQQYPSTLLGLCLIKLIKSQYSTYFSWKPYPTRANPTGLRHLDLLTGIYQSERLFELTWVDFFTQIKDFTRITEWQRKVSPYLLY